MCGPFWKAFGRQAEELGRVFLWGLTPGAAFPIIHSLVGAWLSLVERSVRDREVGGSNPLAPTTNLTPINVTALLVKVIAFWQWPTCGQKNR
jgi:hypothetical protein